MSLHHVLVDLWGSNFNRRIGNVLLIQIWHYIYFSIHSHNFFLSFFLSTSHSSFFILVPFSLTSLFLYLSYIFFPLFFFGSSFIFLYFFPTLFHFSFLFFFLLFSLSFQLFLILLPSTIILLFYTCLCIPFFFSSFLLFITFLSTILFPFQLSLSQTFYPYLKLSTPRKRKKFKKIPPKTSTNPENIPTAH